MRGHPVWNFPAGLIITPGHCRRQRMYPVKEYRGAPTPRYFLLRLFREGKCAARCSQADHDLQRPGNADLPSHVYDRRRTSPTISLPSPRLSAGGAFSATHPLGDLRCCALRYGECRNRFSTGLGPEDRPGYLRAAQPLLGLRGRRAGRVFAKRRRFAIDIHCLWLLARLPQPWHGNPPLDDVQHLRHGASQDHVDDRHDQEDFQETESLEADRLGARREF